MSRNVSRRVFQKTLFSVACVLAMGGTHAAAHAADGKLDVVASFSILADMVAAVGGASSPRRGMRASWPARTFCSSMGWSSKPGCLVLSRRPASREGRSSSARE